MIKITETNLPGVLKIERKPLFEDHRGIYGEIFREKDYLESGINLKFVEQDFSTSKKNVLRGMHGDSKTWKLVCCPFGELYLTVLNYDPKSPFFGKWEGFTLNPKNCLQILIPPMHANGHLVLSEQAMFHYNQSEYYNNSSGQFTVKWDDPRFNILWPICGEPILSDRDKVIKTNPA